jgi:hypothetical protein
MDKVSTNVYNLTYLLMLGYKVDEINISENNSSIFVTLKNRELEEYMGSKERTQVDILSNYYQVIKLNCDQIKNNFPHVHKMLYANYQKQDADYQLKKDKNKLTQEDITKQRDLKRKVDNLGDAIEYIIGIKMWDNIELNPDNAEKKISSVITCYNAYGITDYTNNLKEGLQSFAHACNSCDELRSGEIKEIIHYFDNERFENIRKINKTKNIKLDKMVNILQNMVNIGFNADMSTVLSANEKIK